MQGSDTSKSLLLILLVIICVFLTYLNWRLGLGFFLVVSVIAAIVSSVTSRANQKKMKNEIMPALSSKFGTSAATFDDTDDPYTTRFIRGTTVFVSRIQWSEIEGVPEAEFIVKFNLPKTEEKFYIQHRSVFANYSSDCQPVSSPAVP
jgi:ABC-type multidrug transport system fused ATPase/permease subunit